MSKRVEKVVSLEGQKKAERDREAALFAEAMFKDNPSPEARAVVDAKIARDREAGDRGDYLADEAFDAAFEKFWLGYYTKARAKDDAEQLKRELGRAEASPAERILIDHAAMCHVRLGMVELLYSRNTSGRLDITEHYEKRLTLAQKRFTRAVETLARVRALLARAEVARDAAERSRAGRGLTLARKAG